MTAARQYNSVGRGLSSELSGEGKGESVRKQPKKRHYQGFFAGEVDDPPLAK